MTNNFKFKLIENESNIEFKILNDDISLKLTKIFNELNLTFTVDNLIRALDLIAEMGIESFEMSILGMKFYVYRPLNDLKTINIGNMSNMLLYDLFYKESE